MGGRSMPRLVPTARSCGNAKRATSTGITSTPPPIPSIPLITPMIRPTKSNKITDVDTAPLTFIAHLLKCVRDDSGRRACESRCRVALRPASSCQQPDGSDLQQRQGEWLGRLDDDGRARGENSNAR